MEYVAIAQGQGITPHSFKHGGGPTLFYMQRGADKVSADCTFQIKCKVDSSYWALPLTYSETAVAFSKPAACTWKHTVDQHISQLGQWADSDMCAWGFLQCPVITDSLKVNCHLKLCAGVDNPTDPLVLLLVVLKKYMVWHCHTDHKPSKNPQGYHWNSVLIHFEWRPADRFLHNAYQVWQNCAVPCPDNCGHL